MPKKQKSYRVKAKEELGDYYTPKPDYVFIKSPQDVYNAVNLEHEDRETFVALYLNTNNKVIKKETVSMGSLNASTVHPREIYKAAVLNSAAGVIVAHNHPSGDPTPSRDDLEITERLHKAGEILGIGLIDHVIVGESGQYYSMKERGNLSKESIL